MYSKILVSFLIVILVIAGSRRTNASPVSIQSSSLIYKREFDLFFDYDGSV